MQQEIQAAQRSIREIRVDEKLRRYMLQIVHASRKCDELALGAGPRGSLALFRASQAMAALLFDFVTRPDLRDAVQREFAHTKAQFEEYLKALEKTYQVPTVADPK